MNALHPSDPRGADRTPPQRRRWACLALLLAALWLMGLGGGNEATKSNIPIPEQNFTATVEDASGQSLEAKRFTWEGKVHFRATYGSATITLPFEKLRRLTVSLPFAKVRSVTVGPAADRPELIAARITLRSGETVAVLLDRTSKLYGETKFGEYEIFLKDVARITFQ